MSGAPSSKGRSTPVDLTPYQSLTPGLIRFKKIPDSGQSFDFEEAIASVFTESYRDEKGRNAIISRSIYLVDPGQSGTSPLKPATIYVDTSGDAAGFLSVVTGRFQRQDSAAAGVLSSNKANRLVYDFSNYGFQGTSAVNTALVVTFDTKGLNQVLAIALSYSALSGTLTVEGSMDNFVTQDIIIDIFPAAASFAKNYVNSTVGTVGAGFTAVSPLAFRFLRITAGAGGAASTATLQIAMK